MTGLVIAQAPDDALVSPGVIGFLATFAVMVAFIVLMRSFRTHMRRLNVNARKAELAKEADVDRAAENSQSESVSDPVGDSDGERGGLTDDERVADSDVGQVAGSGSDRDPGNPDQRESGSS